MIVGTRVSIVMLYDNSKRVIDLGQKGVDATLERGEPEAPGIVSFVVDHIVRRRRGVLKFAFIQSSVRWDLRV
jgi:hypothetical protein